MRTRTLLVDNHPMFCEGLHSALAMYDDIEVIRAVQDGHEAVRVALEQQPAVMITDIGIAGMNGIEATRHITGALPHTKVLGLSSHTSSHLVLAMLDAGAAGYVLKHQAVQELVTAIRTVMAHEMYLSAAVASVVMEAYKSRHLSPAPSAFSTLTAKEREVLQLIAEGYASKAIAARLYVSEKTVGTHREHLMRKLDIHSIAGLTKYAIREGLTVLEC